MQGFNRYIPPDYDPKQHSTLNSHQGKKHALGKRAKDIDKGILIVRFELPFNIWCGTCGNHIGAGVRYNAQKKKVGNYYSTPIYAFRCKCHLCSGWFELRTDPQNSRYVVEEGAKQKDEDWNPEEHGGYAARDSEAPSAADPPADPIAALEKTIDQQQWAKRNTSRLTELSDHSARISSDPYSVSLNLRRRFREEKKVMLEKQKRDDGLRERYGIHEDVDLGEEDIGMGREMWEAGRERRGLAVDPVGEEDEAEEASIRAAAASSASVGSVTPKSMYPWGGKGKAAAGAGGPMGGSPSLAQVLRKTTARKYDPFAADLDGLVVRRGRGAIKPKIAKIKDPDGPLDPPPVAIKQAAAVGLVAAYDSD